MKRMPKPARDPESIDYDALNTTELVQIAQFNEIPGASKAVPREILVHVLKRLEAIEVENPMDRIRRRLVAWFTKFWPKLAMQVPLREPADAQHFSDMEAAKFWVKNRDRIT